VCDGGVVNDFGVGRVGEVVGGWRSNKLNFFGVRSTRILGVAYVRMCMCVSDGLMTVCCVWVDDIVSMSCVDVSKKKCS